MGTGLKDVPRLLLKSKEMLNDLRELLPFLPHGDTARFFKCKPLDLRDFIKERLSHEILGHIIPPIQQKSGDVDLVQTVNNGPADEGPRVPVAQGQVQLTPDPIA